MNIQSTIHPKILVFLNIKYNSYLICENIKVDFLRNKKNMVVNFTMIKDEFTKG